MWKSPALKRHIRCQLRIIYLATIWGSWWTWHSTLQSGTFLHRSRNPIVCIGLGFLDYLLREGKKSRGNTSDMLITSVLETCVSFLSFHHDCMSRCNSPYFPFIASVGTVIVRTNFIISLRWLDTVKRGLPSFLLCSDHIAYIRYFLCQIDNLLRLTLRPRSILDLGWMVQTVQ